jgi:hypothetical protein
VENAKQNVKIYTMALQPKLVIFLQARGQLIFNGTLERIDPPQDIRYATCVNYGICAVGQAPEFFETAYVHYEQGGSMDSLLPILGKQYETYHKEDIKHAKDVTDKTDVLYELKRQSSGFWTEKRMEYEKYLRFYPKKGIHMNCTPFAFIVDGNHVEEVSLEGCYSTTQRIKMTEFIKNVKERYPFPMEIYDAGCLKVLSNEELMETGVSEPNQNSRREFAGGRKSRKKRKTKRRKIF